MNRAPSALAGRRLPRPRRVALAMLATALGFAAVLAGCGTPVSAVTARTFYLSPTGNDRASGLSASTAWRTLDRASRQTFAPGDRVLLQGGARFAGVLSLGRDDAGNAAAPVLVGSYGAGRATIAAAGRSAVVAYNTAGIVIRDLVVVGDAAAYRAADGILVYTDLAGSRLAGVTIARVDASGFKNGVSIGAGPAGAGFSDVTVTGSVLHHNMEAGLATYGPGFDPAAPRYALSNVIVTSVEAHTNLGDATNLVRNTGNGIVLGSVDGGRIEASTAHGNGWRCAAPEGPAGIWTYDSTAVVIRKNTAYSNGTGGVADGDGFDLDQNVSRSVLEDNVSYQNAGAGYLVYTGRQNSAHAHNVVRRNSSRDDARTSWWYGGITLYGAVSDVEVSGNTVVMSANKTARPPAIRLGDGVARVTLSGNVLQSDGTTPFVGATALGTGAALLRGNEYRTPGGWTVAWGSSTYSSLAAWRTATGQEPPG